jgi:hypothetical protein
VDGDYLKNAGYNARKAYYKYTHGVCMAQEFEFARWLQELGYDANYYEVCFLLFSLSLLSSISFLLLFSSY